MGLRGNLGNIILLSFGLFSFIGFGYFYQKYPAKVSRLFSLPQTPELGVFTNFDWKTLVPKLPSIRPPNGEISVARGVSEVKEPGKVGEVEKEGEEGLPAPAGNSAANPTRVEPTPTKVPETLPIPTIPREVKPELKISEADINQYLTQLPKEGLPVTNLRIAFRDGKVAVAGTLIQPVNGEIVAEINIYLINEKQIGLKIEKATVNGFPLPTFLLPAIESPFNDFLGSQLSQYFDYRLETLEITEGYLRLTGAFSLK